MITVLLLLKQLLDFAKKYGLEKNLSVNPISSTNSISGISDSAVVFSNYGQVILAEVKEDKLNFESVLCTECRLNYYKMKSRHRRLNTMKKIEGEEDSNILNGIISNLKGNLVSSAADCNSNNLTIDKENMLLCSNDSIQDFHEFLHDNSDYQWFLDYGYKSNNCSHHQSILSLSRSQDFIYYDDMARNIDANLAEVDMDDFNREDIHSVLSSIPNMQGAEEREMFASVSGSMMVKFNLDSSISKQCDFQEDQINTSVCKSQLLFSPLRESYLPNSNLSVDSLDLSENDINLMVTCQSNKNNYTIAFEASTVLTSDDLETRVTCEGQSLKSEVNKNMPFNVDLENKEPIKKERFQSDNQLTTSDSNFTTWSKIKENPNENMNLKQQINKNNNTAVGQYFLTGKEISSSYHRSLSLPNLFGSNQKQFNGMTMSVKLNSEIKRKSSFSNDCQYVKLYDIQSNLCNSGNSSSSASGKPAQNFSLVKLFMKQKSESHEGMSNFMTEQTVPDESCVNYKLNLQNIKSNEKNFTNSKIIETNQFMVDNSSGKKFQNTNLIRELNGNDKIKKVDLKPSKPNYTTSLNENYGFCNEKKLSRNSYHSDESTQENGSNTESAENITCKSIKSSLETENKKLSTEKSIQTSKLYDKNENTHKKLMKVPVYILYPNYSLPNLEFLTKEHYIQNIDFSKVFLKPQKFKMSQSPVASPNSHTKSRRPFSVNDIETLKKTGFKHIKDWESLTFLLPKEYKEFLQGIPEIVAQLKDIKNSKEEVVPLFCLSPPPNRRVRKRPSSYDVNIINDCRSSNYSSTATQPSSGYRGSSTMLNSNHSNNSGSPRNPSFSYKCDTNSESSSSRKSGSLYPNKNCYSNSDDYNDCFRSRPPLPKSILRNNSLDNQQYTCKTQKENANKRYSMVELTDKNIILEEMCNKKRSVPRSSKSPQNLPTGRINEQRPTAGLAESDPEKSSKNAESQEAKTGSNLEKDMRKLEELLEISAVFGESVESFTETDMIRLRSQVSKFLTMQKNLEKVNETLQTVDEGKADELHDNTYEESYLLNKKHLHTPHNTPERKRPQPCGSNSKDINSAFFDVNISNHNGEFEVEDCKFKNENFGGLKKTVSFAEKISFAVKDFELSKGNTAPKSSQVKAKRPVDLPICEESLEGIFSDSSPVNLFQNSANLLRKRDLVLDVKTAIKKILKLCKETSDDPANICLHHLCPSLYAVLSDGLKEEIETPFGPIRNSVWSVIEASSQQGPMTQTLNELVQRLNREDVFTEGLIKFNAFIFGLLNARALSGWFSYLRTRDSLLHKYYENSGLLVLSNTAGAPVRTLVDRLINILEPLGSLQFNLDLMYQTKLLHCSLQNLNCLLEEPSNSDFLTPTKQFILLKLVQSIQNSINQSSEGKNNKHLLEDIEQKTSDPPLKYLLEKNKSVRTRLARSKTRPRSGLDTAVKGQEVNDVVSVMKKRWSGVNLNSKLVEAFDRLVDDSESDYTDSLDLAAPRSEQNTASPVKKVLKEKNSIATAEDSGTDLYTKVQKKNILLNLNKKGCRAEFFKTELDDTESSESCRNKTQNGGQKFKRLQQKWERLSGKSPSDSDSDIKSQFVRTSSNKAKEKSFKSHKSEKSNCDTNITTPSPTSRISKIPRLVTSPVSVSATSTLKQAGNLQNILSPTNSGDVNQKTEKVVQNSAHKGNTHEGKVIPSAGSKFSKRDEKLETGGTSFGKHHSISPSDVPSKRYNSTKKNESVIKKEYLNRKPGPKKLHHAQRTVQTLTHRLPSDSGYLSFNKGEKLKVVLDVDKTWLLCCRGNQKGLVPKSLVISVMDDKF